jgi:hypothetical protein
MGVKVAVQSASLASSGGLVMGDQSGSIRTFTVPGDRTPPPGAVQVVLSSSTRHSADEGTPLFITVNVYNVYWPGATSRVTVKSESIPRHVTVASPFVDVVFGSSCAISDVNSSSSLFRLVPSLPPLMS